MIFYVANVVASGKRLTTTETLYIRPKVTNLQRVLLLLMDTAFMKLVKMILKNKNTAQVETDNIKALHN